MAQLQQPFNALAIDPTQGGGFRQLPVGTHPVVIVASEVKATKDSTGGMVVFELEVIDGPCKGSGGNWYVNLYSQSDAARRIAESTMSALCHATGIYQPVDTSQLHGIPFAVVVTEQALTADQKVKQANGEKVTPFTEVKRVLNADGSEVKPNGQQQAPVQAPSPVQAPAPQQVAQAPQGAAWGPAAGAAPTPAWGGQPAAQAPAQAPVQAPAAAWQQGAGGGTPAWGRK